MTSLDPPRNWALDRKIPAWSVITFVVLMLLQVAGWIAQAAKADARLSTLEAQQQDLKAVPAAIARLEERSAATGAAVDRIEQRLNDRR